MTAHGRSARCVTSGNDCVAPANLQADTRGRLVTCYRCGAPVCREVTCSTLALTPWPVGTGKVRARRRVRTCAGCLRQDIGDAGVRALVEAADAAEAVR